MGVGIGVADGGSMVGVGAGLGAGAGAGEVKVWGGEVHGGTGLELGLELGLADGRFGYFVTPERPVGTPGLHRASDEGRPVFSWGKSRTASGVILRGRV